MTQKPKRLKLEPTAEPSIIPILADELVKEIPLIEVYVGRIKEPKTISKVVVDLNSVLPIPELTHLKRVRTKEILLCLKSDRLINEVLPFLSQKGFDSGLLEDQLKIVSVAAVAPKIRKQYEVVHKLWPCNFHSNSYLEKLTTNTLFSVDELQQHEKFMQITFDIGKVSKVKCSTIVVDPAGNSLVGFGYSQISDYPTKHSVMVAIDEVARKQNGGAWKRHADYSKIQTYLKDKYKDLKFGFSSTEEGPYLCTGYAVYTVYEPCITCAMALIHSRAKRVFYSVNSVNGALGSLCKIHCVENLNHHYEVFAGLLKNECDFV